MFKTGLSAPIVAAMILTGSAQAALPTGSASGAETYVTDAQKSIASGNLPTAEIELKNALQADPANASARILLASVYLKLGNPAAAEAEIRLAREHSASEASTAALLARALSDQGKVDQLFQQVHPGTRPAQDESAVRVTLGLAHLSLGEVDNAVPLIDQALQLDPTSGDAKIAKARIFLVQRDLGDADNEVDSVLSKDPKRIDALDLKGEILIDQGKPDDALTRFDAVLQSDPNDVGARIGHASVLISQNKLNAALEDVNAVLKFRPRQLNAVYLGSLVLAKQGRYSEADQHLDKVGDQFSRFATGLYLQGAVKFHLQQFAQADALLTKFVARQPDNAAGRHLLARIALAERDPGRALSTLQPLLIGNAADSEALTLAGQAYAVQGKLDQSLDAYQKAAALKPDDASLQTTVAVMRMDAGHIDQGLAGLEALSESPQGGKVAGPVLVLSALKLGKLDEASKAAENLVKTEPNDSAALNLLGMVRVAQKNYADAEAIFKQTIQRDGTFVAARRNLAQLYVVTDRLDDAKATYQKILDANGSDVLSLTGLAKVALLQKDSLGAAEYLKRAQSVSVNDPTPGIDLMRLYATQKDWKSATSLGQDLAAKFPSSVAVLETIGQVQTASGDIAGAVATFQRVTVLSPKSPTAWVEYAQAQRAAKDLRAARASLMQALLVAPQNEQIETDLVDLDYEAGGDAEALKTAQSFAKDDPVGADILSAKVLAQAGRGTDAVALLKESQQKRPTTKTLLSLVAMEGRQGHSDDALTLLQDWVKGHDADSAARQVLAETYLAQKQFGPAVTEFERLKTDQPRNFVVLNDLAWLYQQANDPRARAVAQQAYALAPNSPAVADTLGWILVNGGDAKTALPYLKEAATASEQNMDFQYHLAVALEHTGQVNEARALLERIVDSKQSFDSKGDAEKLLGQLKAG